MGKFRVSEQAFRDQAGPRPRRPGQVMGRKTELNRPESFSRVLEDAMVVKRYLCNACNAVCLRLNVPKTFRYEDLPVRKRDGSTVVPLKKMGKDADYVLGKGEPISIKREGGFEKQYRLNCTRCECPVGYFTTNEDKGRRKRLFVLKGAVKTEAKWKYQGRATNANSSATTSSSTSTSIGKRGSKKGGDGIPDEIHSETQDGASRKGGDDTKAAAILTTPHSDPEAKKGGDHAPTARRRADAKSGADPRSNSRSSALCRR
mmetsp:Transcript_37380/g.72409  ORF Transcript_37380/g.72409 Transcript_37380/m.72409 type:complete len:260 (-) Transcript_37380:41-820(-)